MISITKIFEFEAAHQLRDHPGLCSNLHGHSYKLEISVMREEPETVNDMVCDFGDLKAVVASIVKRLDHGFLNEEMATNRPTAENMLQFFIENITWEKLPYGVVPCRIRIWETSTSYAEWRR